MPWMPNIHIESFKQPMDDAVCTPSVCLCLCQCLCRAVLCIAGRSSIAGAERKETRVDEDIGAFSVVFVGRYG